MFEGPNWNAAKRAEKQNIFNNLFQGTAAYNDPILNTFKCRLLFPSATKSISGILHLTKQYVCFDPSSSSNKQYLTVLSFKTIVNIFKNTRHGLATLEVQIRNLSRHPITSHSSTSSSTSVNMGPSEVESDNDNRSITATPSHKGDGLTDRVYKDDTVIVESYTFCNFYHSKNATIHVVSQWLVHDDANHFSIFNNDSSNAIDSHLRLGEDMGRKFCLSVIDGLEANLSSGGTKMGLSFMSKRIPQDLKIRDSKEEPDTFSGTESFESNELKSSVSASPSRRSSITSLMSANIILNASDNLHSTNSLDLIESHIGHPSHSGEADTSPFRTSNFGLSNLLRNNDAQLADQKQINQTQKVELTKLTQDLLIIKEKLDSTLMLLETTNTSLMEEKRLKNELQEKNNSTLKSLEMNKLELQNTKDDLTDVQQNFEIFKLEAEALLSTQQRELQKKRFYWVPNDEINNCHSCHVPFSFFKRKHHCRDCGNIFCSQCSPNTKCIKDTPVRICIKCED